MDMNREDDIIAVDSGLTQSLQETYQKHHLRVSTKRETRGKVKQ